MIQPSVLRGESDGVAMLSQFNAHGLFIALEEVGYLAMSLSFLCLAFAFRRWLRWLLAGSCAVMLYALVYYCGAYGLAREYRLEVAAITIDWLTLLAVTPLLALHFARRATAARD